MTAARRLNDAGIARMHSWLDTLKELRRGDVPDELLTGSEFTVQVEGPAVPQLLQRSFASRLQWGAYIDSVLHQYPTRALQLDTGVWAWLTLFYFDQVCPKGGNGERKVLQRARYIPSGSNYQTYYRHLLQGPWRVVRAHRDDPARALAVLSGALHTPGELAEQLMSRSELISSSTAMRCATTLYIDADSQRPKRGAGGSKAGSPRRLAGVLSQFDVTWDIYQMSSERLLGLLPREFEKFKST